MPHGIFRKYPSKHSKNCTKNCKNERSTLDDQKGAVTDCSIPWGHEGPMNEECGSPKMLPETLDLARVPRQRELKTKRSPRELSSFLT